MGPSKRHDAIHFHDDDTADVGWPESVALTVPDDWQSGVYALRIRAAGEEDHLPFFVLSPRGKATNPIAVLFPTLSYLAYANECVDPAETAALNPLYDLSLRREELSYAEANGLKSTYDSHVDRSGICFSAVRRPNFDFRPRARSRIVAAPRQFPADLYLVDWLEQVGFDFDVISDFDLHNEGADLLRQYRVVLTGSHPEYWSGAMIEARDGYLQGGGRLMYLGGGRVLLVDSRHQRRWRPDRGSALHWRAHMAGATRRVLAESDWRDGRHLARSRQGASEVGRCGILRTGLRSRSRVPKNPSKLRSSLCLGV
jgi:hypothetical protein